MARAGLSKRVTFEASEKGSPVSSWEERVQVEGIASSKALS